jgi:hypothetical protein
MFNSTGELNYENILVQIQVFFPVRKKMKNVFV